MIYIITNCTNGKRTLPNDLNLFRNYTNNDIESVYKEWIYNLNNSNSKCKAKDLYKGVGWKAILEAQENFKRLNETQLLISSAGYGLIDSEKLISSYGITFSKKHQDSVGKYFSNKSWWDNINKENINITDVEAIFICVSKEYLLVMNEFLDELIERYGKRIFFININGNKEKIPKYQEYSLFFDKKYNSFEPGTLLSLRQRILRWLSKEIVKEKLSFNHSILQNYINKYFKYYEIEPLKKGIQLDDEKIKNKIREMITLEKINSASKGLVFLRKNGFSCEQKRFQNLFKNIKEELL